MRKLSMRLLIFVCSVFVSVICLAQDTTVTKSVDDNQGKIYVVMAVCITILTGLIIYLITIDRKISKIENQDL